VTSAPDVQEAYGGAGRVPAGGAAGGQARLPTSFQQVGFLKMRIPKYEIGKVLSDQLFYNLMTAKCAVPF
jgi:hypothetical protein